MRFKTCSVCRQTWKDRKSFLGDAEVVLVGYQVNFGELQAGLFLFNHERPQCRTTLAINAEAFLDLYDGPIFDERATGTAECSSYCLQESNLSLCPTKCECAYVREVLNIIRRWRATAGG